MQETKTNRWFLSASLVLGLLAAVVAFTYLDRGTKEVGPRGKILVAVHDLRENAQLDPDKDVKEMEIPSSYKELYNQAVKADDKAAYKNQRVNRPIMAGTPIWTADIAVGMTDLQLKGSARAISILVKGAQGLTGLLVPGDFVKLYIALPGTPPGITTMPALDPNTDSTARYHVEPILPDPVRVLAVGTRLSRSRQQVTLAEQYQTNSEPEAQQTITVEVSEAQIITLLQHTGPVGQGQVPVIAVLCPKPAQTETPGR